jgi:hypothetical protein
LTATTWDPVFRKVNTNLSGANLVATSTGAGGVASSRSATQNFYAEFTPTTVTGTPRVGISSLTAPQTTSLENALYCLGYDASGAVKVNNVTLATIAAWAQGNRIDMAVNVLMALIWFRVAGGNWNNNVVNDPATNTGGIDFSSMTIRGSLDAAVSASLTGTVWTAAFTTFAGTAPAGYVSLDGATSIAVKQGVDGVIPPANAPDASPAIFLGAPLRDTRIYRYFQPAGAITTVSGTTKEGGTPVAGRKVEVYDRATGDLIGNRSIPALGRPAVRVVGSDPTTYNSVVYDNVVPV